MGEAMRKVFVCGSAGFLMSNLMRYMLYRTRDYGFASVDCLRRAEDHKRVYKHRSHTFYVGDAGDKDLIERLFWIEDPDIVVLGTGIAKGDDKLDSAVRSIAAPAAAICDSCNSKRRLVIQLAPDDGVQDMGDRSTWNHVESMVLGIGGLVLRLPSCFGMRGNGQFEDALRKVILGQEPEGWRPDSERRWYAYAEDVASMLWFLMENSPERSVVRMPALGCASPMDMMEMSSAVHGRSWGRSIESSAETGEVGIPNWAPDSVCMEEAVVKTAKWYMMNRWVFNSMSTCFPRPPAGK